MVMVIVILCDAARCTLHAFTLTLMRIFINEKPIDVPDGTDALSALRGVDAEMARRVEAGAGYITDGRAIRLTGKEPLSAGDILRVVMTRRGGDMADADA